MYVSQPDNVNDQSYCTTGSLICLVYFFICKHLLIFKNMIKRNRCTLYTYIRELKQIVNQNNKCSLRSRRGRVVKASRFETTRPSPLWFGCKSHGR